MSTYEVPNQNPAGVASLPRVERRRARPEDFEMIERVALYEWAVDHESELASARESAEVVPSITRPALMLAPAAAAA